MPDLQDTTAIARLKKRSDFVRTQKQGRKWIAKSFIVEVIENNENQLRVGFTVSKRVSKLAVTRNLLKRHLRHAAREVLESYAHHSIDLVLIARQSTKDQDFKTLQKDLHWCLRKLGFDKK